MILRRSAPRSRTRRRRSDQGSATLEITILFPVLLLLVFGTVQGALYYHGHNLAFAAATSALHTAAGTRGSADAASSSAREFLGTAGDKILTGATVTVDRTATTATVTVSGRVPVLVPGLPTTVTATVTGPVEHLTSAGAA